MKIMTKFAFKLATLIIAIGIDSTIHAAQIVQVFNFGNNPSGIQMFEYVPGKVVGKPALLVALHWCGGSGQAMYSGSKYAQLADIYGFIVIYPSAIRSTKCWDVYSVQGLRRNGGSDSQGIVSMVNYEIQKHNVNPEKIYVTGLSSGAMMTNVLLAEYPDVFRAGFSVFAGVAFTCFATTAGNTWNSTCAQGRVDQSPSQWGNLVRSAYPGYKGSRPRVQLMHGTSDNTLNYKNLQEEVDQWTNVLGVSQNPASTDQPNVGLSGVTAIRRRYGGANNPPLEAITLQGAGHFLSLGGTLAELAARFMGLIK